MRRFRENFYDADKPEKFGKRWEEKVVLVLVVLWFAAEIAAIAYLKM